MAIATRSKEVNSILCHCMAHFCRNSFVRPTQVVFFGVEINKLVQGARESRALWARIVSAGAMVDSMLAVNL